MMFDRLLESQNLIYDQVLKELRNGQLVATNDGEDIDA